MHNPHFSKHWTRHFELYKTLTVMVEQEYYLPNHMAQSRAYIHKQKHESLTHYKIMVQSNTKHTDLDRIDTRK